MKMELVVFCKPCLQQLQDWAWGLNERVAAACCSQWLGRALTASFPKLRAFPYEGKDSNARGELTSWRRQLPLWVLPALAFSAACPARGRLWNMATGVLHATGIFLVAGIQGNIAKETGGHWDQIVHTVSDMLIFTGTCCWSSPPRTRSAQG